MITSKSFKEFFITQIEKVNLSDCEYISLTGGMAEDKFILNWSDIDLILVSKSMTSKLLTDILNLEKVCSEYFSVKVHIEIIQKDIFINSLKNIDSTYFKYYKHIIGGLNESNLLYRNNSLDIKNYSIKKERMHAINPMNGIHFIFGSLIRYVKSSSYNNTSYQRKLYKNIFYMYQLYYLSCRKIYKEDNMDLLDTYPILKYISEKKTLWKDYKENHINELEKIMRNIYESILLEYKSIIE
jgi:predicted nucleotidyltransferase